MNNRLSQMVDIRGVTPYRVAKDLGISHQTILNYLKGATQPSSKNLTLIANYLKVSVSWLLTGAGSINIEEDKIDKELDKVDKELGLEKEDDLTIARLITLLEKKDQQLENLIRMLDDQIQINKKISVRKDDDATCAAASGYGIEK